MGDAILSILVELCKLLTYVVVCTCNTQVYFLGKAIPKQVKGGDRREQNVGVAQQVEMGVWELSLEGQPLLGNLTGMLSVPGVEPGSGSGSRNSGPALVSHLASCSFALFSQRLLC